MAAAEDAITTDNLAQTPLHELHLELGARMVPFAGYEMPVQYPMGILGEHEHTRDKAGLFDVSHMGQLFLTGPDHDSVAAALEALVPADIKGLAPGRTRYTQLLNASGGIVDDLMVTRPALRAGEGEGRLYLVVNASRKHADIACLEAHLADGIALEEASDRALLALQGPAAAAVMAQWCPQADGLSFMGATNGEFAGIDCHIARSGYTGEDGFELSVAAGRAAEVARTLLTHDDVAPVGLGARDTLRLEAGLCLYGHDIDETTSPIEAGLSWSIQKRRREEGGFPGEQRILRELADGPERRRAGLVPAGRAPAREGTGILSLKGKPVGAVTSGSFAPTYGGPVAMGYVETAFADPGTEIGLSIRGKVHEARIVALPFVPHRYHRPGKRN